MTRKTCIVLVLAALSGLAAAMGFQDGAPPATPARRVDFQKEIRPIFSANCYQCHGPDDEKRESDLRLDRRESAFRDRGGYRAIVPGQPEESELYLLISSEFPDDRMPPSDAEKTLTAEQIELIRLWIEQGAEWKEHGPQ